MISRRSGPRRSHRRVVESGCRQWSRRRRSGTLSSLMTRRLGSAMAGTCLRFGLLGPLLLNVAGTPVALGTPKQRAILAMLLINRNRAIGTESLIDAAWDQSPVPA